MKIPKKVLSIIMGFLILMPPLSMAKTLNTFSIIAATAQALPQCIHYRVLGLCYWLFCSGLHCAIEPTLKIAHYSPDVVVSVFSRMGDNPWLEENLILDKPAEFLAKKSIKKLTGFTLGGGQHSMGSKHENQVHFKEVDVTGNPTSIVLGNMVTLPSQAMAWKHYFNSRLDVLAWRFGSEWFEHLSKANLTHASFPWGTINPHDGFINQADDFKAAGVIATRAIDIITNSHQFHVYKALNNESCGKKCNAINPISPNHPHPALWQMLSPVTETSCKVFGRKGFNSGLSEYKNYKPEGAYTWNLWRYYEGCIDGHGKYIGSTKF